MRSPNSVVPGHRCQIHRRIHVGTGSAVPGGQSPCGRVTIAGVALFGHALTQLRVTFIALIVVGLVGLRFVEQ